MSTITSHEGATEAPIACTLTADDYRTRIGELSALSARALRLRESIDGGERWVFAAGDEVEEALRAAVAAEAACCPFLTLNLDRRDDALVLDVTGPADSRPIIAELFA